MKINWESVSAVRHRLLLLLIIFLGGCWLYWQSWMEQKELKKELLQRLAGLTADFTAEGISYYRISDGVLKIRMNAKQAMFLNNDGMSVNEPTVLFFLSDGRQILTRAAKGFYKDDQLSLTGEVKMDFPEYGTVSTSELFYDQTKKIAWTNTPVLFSGESMLIKGDGLEYGVEKGEIRVFKPQAQIYPNVRKLIGW